VARPSKVQECSLLGAFALLGAELEVLLHGELAAWTVGLLASVWGASSLWAGRLLAWDSGWGLSGAWGLLHDLGESAARLASLGDSLSSDTTLNLWSGRRAGSLGGLSSLRDNLSVALLEGPFTGASSDDSLASLSLATSNWGHGGWARVSSSTELRVTEGLDGGLELVVSVQVGWVADWMELLLEEWLERVHDQSALESSVGGEDGGRVDLAELEAPLGDHDNLGLKVLPVGVGELALELSGGSWGEVSWHVEVRVGHEEVWAGLLDEDLQVLLAHVSWDLGLVATSLDHLGVKFLECGHC
jgi:hypothetical protein